MPRPIGRWIGQGLIFTLLTLLTQVGGLAQLAALALPRGRRLAAFAAAYLLLTLLIVPPLAGLAGRERLPCLRAEGAVAANPLVCLLNRGYLTLEARALVSDLGEALAARFPGSRVTPLEAGFPFLPGFPLLPLVTATTSTSICAEMTGPRPPCRPARPRAAAGSGSRPPAR